MVNPYSYADVEIAKLKSSISAMFQNTANSMPFDGLNVIKVRKQAKNLFSRLVHKSRVVYERIAKRAYEEAVEEVKAAGFEPKEDTSGKRKGVSVVLSLLRQYHPTTEYVYNNEVGRKQDRFVEAVSSTRSRNDFRNAHGKAARLWFGQVQQYCDLSVDEARIQAFMDSGVKKVRWKAMLGDGKTCNECKERHDQIYLIENVPRKHHRCRCSLIPIKDD